MTPAASGTITLLLKIPWADIQVAFEKEVEKAVKEAEIKGFRKGTAPRNLVEPGLDKNHLYSHAVQELLPEVYTRAVKAQNLKPILYPKIRILKAETGQDWEFEAVTCEIPVVTLPDYKTGISKLPKEPADTKLDRIIDYLQANSQITVPDLLVEEEANHRLSALIENLTQIGLTTESYLASKKMTAEGLKASIATTAKIGLTQEFILLQIQTREKLANRKATLDFLTSLL